MCKEALIIKVFILTLLIVNLKNLNTEFKFKYDLLIIINLKDLNTRSIVLSLIIYEQSN